MLNPIRLVNDIFDDVTFSDIKFQPFANDHLIRLGNNNPGGIYSQLITDTTAAYMGYYGQLTSQDTKVAISEGLTITTNNTKDAVLAKLSSQRGLVAYKFGDDSAIYQEFFPQGLEAYNKARLDDLPRLLDNYVVAATTHLTADFLPEVAAIGLLVTAYANARNTQLGIFSETDTIRTGRREMRKVLSRQLTKNMLTLAIDFLENPDRFDDYYDEEMLPLTTGGNDDGDTPTPPADGDTLLGGTVVNQGTLLPLVGVQMTFSNAAGISTTLTDADGRYMFTMTISETTSGNLTASFAGHMIQARPVTLEPGDDHTEDFQLGGIVPPMP